MEHQWTISDVRIESESILKTLEKQHSEESHYLGAGTRTLLQKKKEVQSKQTELLNEYKLNHELSVQSLCENYTTKIDNLKKALEEKFKILRARYNDLQQRECKKIENLKNTHIQELMKTHANNLTDIKNYYSDITHSNLDLIKTLKAELNECSKQEKNKEQLMLEITELNKHLSTPLKKNLNELNELKDQLKEYENNKHHANKVKTDILKASANLENMQWKYEVLMQKYQHLKQEYLLLTDNNDKDLVHKKQSHNLQLLLLSQQLTFFQEILEIKELQASQLAQTLENNKPLDFRHVLLKKDAVVQFLQSQLHEYQTRYDRAVQYFHTIKQKYHITSQDK
ncbi:hypothetical protein RFI_19135 [Reticulomyxa filosa]|uniref:Growth arrest-specific protein 8 domain-containing protein n=1 Tax=Reticulomyxa filosa TaxID=46433 RepID=X6MXE2_RETFI|nr:hypothetical protein RFI_19135 [Reticulomyxa filosa]|eukprot:ETO18152.1 hypothetical protein RFI_19135 [Reticulomyxa filosa]